MKLSFRSLLFPQETFSLSTRKIFFKCFAEKAVLCGMGPFFFFGLCVCVCVCFGFGTVIFSFFLFSFGFAYVLCLLQKEGKKEKKKKDLAPPLIWFFNFYCNITLSKIPSPLHPLYLNESFFFQLLDSHIHLFTFRERKKKWRERESKSIIPILPRVAPLCATTKFPK